MEGELIVVPSVTIGNRIGMALESATDLDSGFVGDVARGWNTGDLPEVKAARAERQARNAEACRQYVLAKLKS